MKKNNQISNKINGSKKSFIQSVLVCLEQDQISERFSHGIDGILGLYEECKTFDAQINEKEIKALYSLKVHQYKYALMVGIRVLAKAIACPKKQIYIPSIIIKDINMNTCIIKSILIDYLKKKIDEIHVDHHKENLMLIYNNIKSSEDYVFINLVESSNDK